jgi:arylsulfatase A-like enzyme
MVWDGMRPDLISTDLTPNLARLAGEGVNCLDSHAVYPTVTRVNAASLSTGALPGRHGIVGNNLYAPLVERRAPVSIGDHRTLYALIESRGGRLLPGDTLADRVSGAGGRSVIVSSGSPGSAFLCHPRVEEFPGDRLFNPAVMLPASAQDELAAQLGPLPAPTVPNSAQNAYFTRAIVEYVLPALEPTLLVFWHNDPDTTQHNRGFGSSEALQSIRDADANLGTVLVALEARGLRDETALAVVSDHGYVSILPSIAAVEPFVAAGLGEALEAGRIILSSNGCSLLVNAADGDEHLLARVADCLLRWPQAGLVFSGAHGRPPLEGTLPLDLIGCGGDLAADVLCALAWDDQPNDYGHPGRSPGVDRSYLANHGGLSPWEVHNTLVLAGPGFKSGLENRLPTGNLDLAPTLLALLGLEPPPDQDGRVLVETLRGGPDPSSLAVQRSRVGASLDGYHQEIQFSEAAGGRYLDFGVYRRD